MKKVMIVVSVLAVMASVAFAATAIVEGTRIGNAVLAATATNSVAIGGGNSGATGDTGVAYVTAADACQIGNGSNTVSGTVKFEDKFLVSGVAGINTSGLKMAFYKLASGTSQQTLSGFSTMLGAFATYQGSTLSNSAVAAYFIGATNVTLVSSTGMTNAVNVLVVGY